MKIFYILLFAFVMSSCQTTNSTKMFGKDDFELIKATQENWFGGQPGVKGKNYVVYLNKKTPEDVVIDSLFVENVWHKAEVTSENPYTITVHTMDERLENEVDGEFGNVHETESNAPKDNHSTFTGKNVLMYEIGDKKSYLEITEFDKIESKMFP